MTVIRGLSGNSLMCTKEKEINPGVLCAGAQLRSSGGFNHKCLMGQFYHKN